MASEALLMRLVSVSWIWVLSQKSGASSHAGNLKGQRRSVRGFVDELLKQRAHVAEIGFQRDAVGVRFCAANERAQVFDRMADDIDFAVAGHLFIQQRRTPVDFVEIVFERMGDILRVALQNFAAAAAPIIGFPAQTPCPRCPRERHDTKRRPE